MMIKTLLNNTLCVSAYKFIKSWDKLEKQRSKIYPVLHNKSFKNVLAQELGVNQVKQDRAGRLYCIINPQINKHGQFDTNMIIYELDTQGLQFSTDTFVEQWLVRKLRVIQDLFKQRAIFSQLNFNIEHVGPLNHDNYLLIIEPTEFADYQYWKTRLIKRLINFSAIISALYGIIKIWQYYK